MVISIWLIESNVKMIEGQGISFNDAAEMLYLTGDSFMSNPNWDFISIEEPEEGIIDEYSFLVGVYDLEKEKETIGRENIELFDDRLLIEIPLITTSLIASLNRISGSSNTASRMIKVQIIAEEIQERATSNANFKENIGATRIMGNSLAHYSRTNGGALGAYILSKSNELFIVTACHVVHDPDNQKHAKYGDIIVSPPTLDRDIERNKIGTLYWWRHTDYHDIALIKVTENARVGRGSVCDENNTISLGDCIKYKDKVRICSGLKGNEKCETMVKGKCGTVQSRLCYKREKENSKKIMKDLVRTTNMAAPGDSGSIVMRNTNGKNEAIGLMVNDTGVSASYFMSLDVLKERIEETIDGHKIDFEFDKFL